MDVRTLNNGAGRDPLRSTLALALTAAQRMGDVGAEDLAQAQEAVRVLAELKPTPPSPDGREVVAEVMAAILRSAQQGIGDLHEALARDLIARFDADHVCAVAHDAASQQAERRVSQVVAAYAIPAFRLFTSELQAVAADYKDALAGDPFPTSVETVLRQGGKAKARLERLEALRGEAEALSASWRSLRLLTARAGGDPAVFQIDTRFQTRPADTSWAKLERDVRGKDLSLLDVAAQYGLTVWLPSRDDSDRLALEWAAQDREARTGGSRVGATNVNRGH